MIKSKEFLLTAMLCVGVSGLFAQTSAAGEERSITIIRRGIELHDEKKYDEAIEEFKKVHRNDSNYYLANVEILNTYLATNKNKEGIELCDHLLKLKNDYTPNILIQKGDFLDNLGQYEEARKIYEYGVKEYPLNHSFYYEQAIALIRRNKFDEAYDFLVKTIRINPFHAASHFQMGLLAYRTNNVTATMLAFQFYFIADVNTKRARGIVTDLEKICKSEMEYDSVMTLRSFENQNDFTELESIIKSKVALTDKYKSKTNLTFGLVKQMQLLCENIGKYPDVKGFYNEFYGKFFKDLNDAKFFEAYAYHALSGMQIEDVDKWRQKNKSDVEKFENWAYDYVCMKMATYPENLNGKTTSVPHWFGGNVISAAGLKDQNGNNTGYWNFYYKNGIRKSEGEFVNDKKNGPWRFYYPTGDKKEEVVYENGQEKKYLSYYDNNNPKVELNVVDDKIEGLKKVYFSNGNIASTTTYKAGEVNGPQTYYYRNGSMRYTMNNVKDEISGDLVEYFDNGKKYQTVKFVKGNREGVSKTFYNNAANSTESEGNYVKNKPVGTWKKYYRSGKLYKEMTYNEDGKLDGVYKEYYENGKVNSEDQYTEGKLNGLSKNFSDNGQLAEEFTYKKGKLLEYRAFRADGTKICDKKINGKNFKLELYNPNGTKSREGAVSDGDLDGIWKNYNTFGTLIRETNYKEGEFDGRYVEYHNNGKIKTERFYKNGTEDGPYKSYYITGQLQTEGSVVNGSSEGYWKRYYKNGALQSNIYYVDGDINGWSEYYDVTGKLSSENLSRDYVLVKVVYHDTTGAVSQNTDLPGGNGLLEKKTMEGKVVYRQKFVKDYAEGPSMSYFPDGKVFVQSEFSKGKREGKYVVYNPFGVITNESMYFNDEMNGKEKNYDDDGKLSSEYNYDNGEIHGPCFTYHPNGKLYRDLTYDNGDVEGESNMYDPFGELIYKRNFHNDLLVNYTYKDASGQLLKPKELTPGEFKLNCTFPNGKKSIEVTYKSGDLDGMRIIYYSNGKIMEETPYYYDMTHGTAKEYYPDGNLKQVDNYYYGDRDGRSQCFYESGKPKWEKSFKQGKSHGWWMYYGPDGKVLKSLLYYNGEIIYIKQ